MKRASDEQGSRFARALGAWGQQPPRRSAREAVERFRIEAAEAERGRRESGAPAPARWLAWGAVGLGALVAIFAAVRVPTAPPEAPVATAETAPRTASSDPDTVVVHELSSGTRVYLMLPMPAPR